MSLNCSTAFISLGFGSTILWITWRWYCNDDDLLQPQRQIFHRNNVNGIFFPAMPAIFINIYKKNTAAFDWLGYFPIGCAHFVSTSTQNRKQKGISSELFSFYSPRSTIFLFPPEVPSFVNSTHAQRLHLCSWNSVKSCSWPAWSWSWPAWSWSCPAWSWPLWSCRSRAAPTLWAPPPWLWPWECSWPSVTERKGRRYETRAPDF